MSCIETFEEIHISKDNKDSVHVPDQKCGIRCIQSQMWTELISLCSPTSNIVSHLEIEIEIES